MLFRSFISMIFYKLKPFYQFFLVISKWGTLLEVDDGENKRVTGRRSELKSNVSGFILDFWSCENGISLVS